LNTGTHIGHLWTASGTLLASATFTNETASGWQQVNFSTPVAISGGTVYVASYYAPNGDYPASSGYFAGPGAAPPPLHPPPPGVTRGNGVYQSGTGSFPTQTYGPTTYGVDVVFNTSTSSAPPPVTAEPPPPNPTGVSTSTAVTATFSK